MLSYQHMYHAGCLADVHKHAALSLMLAKMVEKDKPISYMETHAGRGLYDLSSPESMKTGEAEWGIRRVVENGVFSMNHPYIKAIESVKAKHGPNFYPGSPAIARASLRPIDKMYLMELHPQEYKALSVNIGKVANVKHCDGYRGVLEISPPQIKRGFVLIDPSYEVKSEYESVTDFVIKLHKKWPVAAILLWYPLLTSGLHKQMAERLSGEEFPKFWQQEILFPKEFARLAIGSGLIAINAPFGIEAELGGLAKIG